MTQKKTAAGRAKPGKSTKVNAARLTGRKLPAIRIASGSTGAAEAVSPGRKGGEVAASSLPLATSPLSLVIPSPPSLNDMFVTNKGGGRGRHHSKFYKEWQHATQWQIARQSPTRFVEPVVILASIQRKSLAADIDNRSKAVLDILKTCGIYRDDSLATGIAWVWGLASATRILIIPAQKKFSITFSPDSANGSHGGWYLKNSEEE